jgi:hypothetical protein
MAGLQAHELGVFSALHIIWGPEFMCGNTSCETSSVCDGSFSWNIKEKAGSYIMQQSFFNPTCMGSQVLSYQIFLIIRWHLS